MMKNLSRRLVLAGILLSVAFGLHAQRPVDRLYMDMRASFHQDFTGEDYASQFLGEHLN